MISEYVVRAFDKLEQKVFYYRIVAISAKDALEKVQSSRSLNNGEFVVYKQCSLDE